MLYLPPFSDYFTPFLTILDIYEPGGLGMVSHIKGPSLVFQIVFQQKPSSSQIGPGFEPKN